MGLVDQYDVQRWHHRRGRYYDFGYSSRAEAEVDAAQYTKRPAIVRFNDMPLVIREDMLQFWEGSGYVNDPTSGIRRRK